MAIEEYLSDEERRNIKEHRVYRGVIKVKHNGDVASKIVDFGEGEEQKYCEGLIAELSYLIKDTREGDYIEYHEFTFNEIDDIKFKEFLAVGDEIYDLQQEGFKTHVQPILRKWEEEF